MGAVSSFSPCFFRKCASCIGFNEGREVGPKCHGMVKVDEDVDCDESSEYTGVGPKVTARLVAPTPAVVPAGRAAPAGG